jgi:streptogramin lyase
MTQDSANDEWFAFRDGTVGFVDQSGSVRIFHRHAANSYPIAIVAAPSDGVWLLDTVTVERFDRRGRIDVERAPAAWRHLRFPVSATMSPCGVLWLLQAADSPDAELKSYRFPNSARASSTETPGLLRRRDAFVFGRSRPR